MWTSEASFPMWFPLNTDPFPLWFSGNGSV